MIKVIDVSEHNGTIDWTKVKPQISGVIIRLGYGSDQANQDDKQWARNVSECERLGIPWGAYLYSYANTADKIRSEIAHTKRLLSGHKPQLPIFYDLEERRYKETWGEAAGMWCKEIRAAGYIDGLYSWAWAINAFLPACASAYWVADYGINDGNQHTKPTLTGGRQLTAWQYTSKGHCAGISSSGLDVSEFYVDYAKGKTTVTPTPQPTAPAAAPSGSTLDLAVAVMQGKYGTGDTRKAKLGTRYTEVQNFLNHIADANAATLAAEVKTGKYGNGDVRKVVLGSKYNAVMAIINTPPKKSIDEIAREVIAGKWGSGDDRKNRLRAAGYDPATVQARVNALMGVSSRPTAPARKSESEIAREVIRGKWGSGQDRKNRLRAAGYDPARIQQLVNAALK